MRTQAEKMLRLRQIAIEFLFLGRSEDRELIEWVLEEIQWLSAKEISPNDQTLLGELEDPETDFGIRKKCEETLHASGSTMSVDEMTRQLVATIPADGEKTDDRGLLFGTMKSDVEARGYGWATIFTGQNGQGTNKVDDMSDEIMIPVDSLCIPDGHEAQRFGYGEAGEMEVEYDDNGIKHRSIRTYDSPIPRLIIRKTYDPGIPLPKGWWVWKCFGDSTAWLASPIVGHLPGDCIWGLEYIPGFIAPPDGQSRQIN